MDFLESPEHALLRATVAGIARQYGHRYYVEAHVEDKRAPELWEELGKHGFLSVHLPTELGGGGMGITELAIVAEEVAAAGCPSLLLVVSPTICATLIARFGSADQKAHWLPGMASGEIKMAFAITEPDAGSNSHRIATTADRKADSYHLNGNKYYISGADEAEAILVVTRTGTDSVTGKGKLSLLIVPTNSKGLTLSRISVEMVSTDRQYSLFFDDVEVPADNLVGQENDGLRQLFYGLNPERILVAAVANGIARYALEKATAYARERRVWDVPIGSHQGLAHPLAERAIQAELARLMTQKAAWLFDNEMDAGEAANMAKVAAADAAGACLDEAIQVHGGNGMATEFGLATMWGITRLFKIAPVSREMILSYVSRHTLGLARSY
jgi:alkylation response protein AidB-like acyl-CoA dehydrogenase